MKRNLDVLHQIVALQSIFVDIYDVISTLFLYKIITSLFLFYFLKTVTIK